MLSGTFIGYLAAFLTTAAFVPQAVKTIRTRDTEGISVLMYLSFTTGIVFWIAYGVVREDPVIIIANSLTFLLALPILLIALNNARKQKAL
ncbi:MAG: SemiSWEET transporter [Parvibaculum sp.]|nr:SemiSWEET transporter [Parvibaculum sp.]